MIRADGDGLAAAQIDIAGRTAGVIPVRALCTVADIVLDLHRAGKSQNAVAIANIATPIYAAASSRIVAGDAAAVHDEIAALMKTHAVSEIFGSTCCCTVGDLAAVLTVGQGEGRRIAFHRSPDIKRISIIYNRNGVAIQTESDITIDTDAPEFL